jgi:RNA polymerase sigma factor (sigma-70 family)
MFHRASTRTRGGVWNKSVDEYEAGLLERMRAGDNAATTRMLGKYERWCCWFAKRLVCRNRTFLCVVEDVRQEVRIAMVAAMREFDPDRGMSLSSWMCRVLNRSSHRFLFKNIGTTVRVPPGAVRHAFTNAPNKIDGLRLVDALVEPNNVMVDLDEVWEEVERLALEPHTIDVMMLHDATQLAETNALERLSERDRQIVLDVYFGDGTTYEEAGDLVGLSRERVRQVCMKFARCAREELRLLGYGDIIPNDGHIVVDPLVVPCDKCSSRIGEPCFTVQKDWYFADPTVPLGVAHAERFRAARMVMGLEG